MVFADLADTAAVVQAIDRLTMLPRLTAGAS